jgi:hypothetical protein
MRYYLVVYTVPCLGDQLYSGTWCGDCTDPWRPFPCDILQRRVLDIAIDKVLRALSMHAVPPVIRIVCVSRMSDSLVSAL